MDEQKIIKNLLEDLRVSQTRVKILRKKLHDCETVKIFYEKNCIKNSNAKK